MRDSQRDVTREKIVGAAWTEMSQAGFDAATTRAIARHAAVRQGLLTYQFVSKDLLWLAAADHLFALDADTMAEPLAAEASRDGRHQVLRNFGRFDAKHPEFVQFLILQGEVDETRRAWLVETHLTPLYAQFARLMSHVPADDVAHAFYAFFGASSVIFKAAIKGKALTGLNAKSDATLERHVGFVANVMVPE